jgi:hypothetical protein
MGRVIAIPGDDGPILLQSLTWNRADGAQSLRASPCSTARGWWSARRSRMRSPRFAGCPAGAHHDLTPIAGAARDERITRLYEVMRDALRRGDWIRFGAAFDSLGALVGRTPR